MGGRHAADGLPQLADRLEFVSVRGMLRGFLDMVFRYGGRYYLVDWKSNHLGNRPEEYGRDSLAGEMDRKLYRLQYLLYTVALNRFLAVRDPAYRYETGFGGVLYLFLRGMDPDRPGNGIFRDLPPAGLVEELTECSHGKRGRALMTNETAEYREIDRVFADFLCRLAGGGDDTLRRVALDVSRSTGEGHICLDLAEAYGEEAAQAATLLSGSKVVGTPGEIAPLILDGTTGSICTVTGNTSSSLPGRCAPWQASRSTGWTCRC